MSLSSADRTRRYRERRRQGVVYLAKVAIYPGDVEALVTCNRLSPEDRGDRQKVADAVGYVFNAALIARLRAENAALKKVLGGDG